jgi:DNA-binding MarR family transcriptional regulator
MSEEEKSMLRRLLKVVDFVRTYNAEMPIQTLGAFLVVALQDGMNVTEIGNRLGLSQSSASRNVSELTERSWKKVEGLKVAEYQQGREKISIKTVHLTDKGQTLAEQIAGLLKGGTKA